MYAWLLLLHSIWIDRAFVTFSMSLQPFQKCNVSRNISRPSFPCCRIIMKKGRKTKSLRCTPLVSSCMFCSWSTPSPDALTAPPFSEPVASQVFPSLTTSHSYSTTVLVTRRVSWFRCLLGYTLECLRHLRCFVVGHQQPRRSSHCSWRGRLDTRCALLC